MTIRAHLLYWSRRTPATSKFIKALDEIRCSLRSQDNGVSEAKHLLLNNRRYPEPFDLPSPCLTTSMIDRNTTCLQINTASPYPRSGSQPLFVRELRPNLSTHRPSLVHLKSSNTLAILSFRSISGAWRSLLSLAALPLEIREPSVRGPL